VGSVSWLPVSGYCWLRIEDGCARQALVSNFGMDTVAG
ncbi:unnamed protein product, partial [Urochloa humidicola]